jgi:hypothetical protein
MLAQSAGENQGSWKILAIENIQHGVAETDFPGRIIYHQLTCKRFA